MKFGKKVYNSIKKEFDSKPVYTEKYLKAKIKSYHGKYLKAKIKSYHGKINTNLYNNKIFSILLEGFQFICLSLILIDSVFRTGKNYYPQVLLEKCKYVVRKKEAWACY